MMPPVVMPEPKVPVLMTTLLAPVTRISPAPKPAMVPLLVLVRF